MNAEIGDDDANERLFAGGTPSLKSDLWGLLARRWLAAREYGHFVENRSVALAWFDEMLEGAVLVARHKASGTIPPGDETVQLLISTGAELFEGFLGGGDTETAELILARTLSHTRDRETWAAFVEAAGVVSASERARYLVRAREALGDGEFGAPDD